MALAHLAVILIAALLGGAVAAALWAVLTRLPERGAGPSRPANATDPPPDPAPDVPVFPDPTLSAQIAAIRADMEHLSQAQSEMAAGMTRWENQLLAEMRAIATAADPAVLLMLHQIAGVLGVEPPEDEILVSDEESKPEEPDPDPPDEGATGPPPAAAAPEAATPPTMA